MLKVGDKLLCKKSHYLVKKNKYYEISHIFVNILHWIYFNDNYFNLNPNSILYIWKYFYKPQEVRKLKLKQLNETKSR